MTEDEARKVFDLTLPVCNVMGLDVRTACVAAGVPGELVDKFLEADRVLTNAMTYVLNDPTKLAPGRAPGPGAPVGEETALKFTSLGQKSTGLPMVIWITTRGATTKTPHVRVQTNHSRLPQIERTACISIEEKPRLLSGAFLDDEDMARAAAFVGRNHRSLLETWEGRGDARTFARKLASAGS